LSTYEKKQREYHKRNKERRNLERVARRVITGGNIERYLKKLMKKCSPPSLEEVLTNLPINSEPED